MHTTKPNIRLARREDLASIVAINQQGEESVWTTKQFTQALEGQETLWVLEQQGYVQAFLLWHSVLDEAEIYHFGVASTSRKQGLGTLLLKHLIEYCHNNGILRLFLEVRDGNLAAKTLYLKHGFVISGHRKNYYQTATGTEDAILMEKTC